MQHRNALFRLDHAQGIARLKRAEVRAVDGDFGAGSVTLEQLDVDVLAGRNDDRTVRQRMRANGDEGNGLDMWLQDRSPAAQRISR